MINTLIFDFGDVFINLDKQAPYTEMKKLGISGTTLKKSILKMLDRLSPKKIQTLFLFFDTHS